MQETQVWFLGQDGPLEKETATHSSILPRGMQQTGYSPQGHKESNRTERLKPGHSGGRGMRPDNFYRDKTALEYLSTSFIDCFLSWTDIFSSFAVLNMQWIDSEENKHHLCVGLIYYRPYNHIYL